LIKPHGSDTLNSLLITDNDKLQQLLTEAESLPSLLLNSAAAANAVMMGGWLF
jgi:sulfate adenylyltransferase